VLKTPNPRSAMLASPRTGKAHYEEIGYPPDMQEKATGILLEQAEVLSANWAVA